MHDERKGPPGRFLFQDGRRVLFRLTGVDHQRQAGFARSRDVFTKHRLLNIPRAAIIEIVQPRLADGDYLRMRGQIHKLRRIHHVLFTFRMVRMRAHAGPYAGKTLGHRQHFGEGLQLGGNGEHAGHAHFVRALHNGLNVLAQGAVCEMAMRIDKRRPHRRDGRQVALFLLSAHACLPCSSFST